MPISDTVILRQRGVRTFPKNVVITLLLILFFLFAVFSVSAAGKKEDRLEQARSLIEQKLYNEAVVILSQVMQEEPRKFDEAQKLLNEVRKARTAYNEKYQELIALYNSDDLNLEEAYKIFKELEEMDKSPNKQTAEAFERAKKTAIFVVNNNRFNRIMEEARSQIDAGNYWEAIATYQSGFDLYIEEYERQDYGNIVTDTIAQTKSRLLEATETFIDDKQRYSSLLEQEAEAFEVNNIDRLQSINDDLASLLLETSDAIKNAAQAAHYFETQNNQIIESSGEEEFHLTFLKFLIRGRSEVEGREGILGAMDIVWENTLTEAETDMVNGFRTAFEQGKQRYTERDLERSLDFFSRSRAFAIEAIELLPLWGSRVNVRDGYALPEERQDLVLEKLALVNEAEAGAAGSSTYMEAIPLVEDLLSIRMRIPQLDQVEEVNSEREAVVNLSDTVSEYRSEWNSQLTYYQSITENDLGGEEALETASETVAVLQQLEAQLVEAEVETVVRTAEITYGPLREEYQSLSSRIEEGVTLLTGFEKTIGEGEGAATVLANDPAGGKVVLEEVQEGLQALKTEVRTVIESLESEKDYIVEDGNVEEQIANGEELVSNIDSQMNESNRYIARAEEQVRLAEKYKSEAFFRVEQAEEALANNEFDRARDQLRIAGERFDRSLEVQEDPELKEERDNLIANLGDEINTAENNLIVAEVRELIEQGKAYYAQESYAQAERVFQKAQSRWKVTHVENKPEIEYWLGIIRIALNVKSGRVIDETDPLYAEMSRLINLAKEDFNRGRELVEQGREEAAAEYFEQAEKKILYVKIPFPLNREASVLALRIEKFRNLDNFETLFRQKFVEARNKLQTNPQEAYIELQDLEAINPDFPGIASAIYDAEIKLGIRIPPPDPAKIRESNELYERAFAIVQSNVRSQFPIALEYLNQAIKLTPDSQKVTNLLDRIEAELGGRTTTVLASTAQQQYKLAEEKYLEGSYYEALRIVNSLMKDEKSSQYPPLLELKRRIESKI